jgi:4-aminobutyrate aminotransferase
MQNARTVGAYMKKSLAEIEARHESIAWVNAVGLMIGVEIVKERGPNAGDAAKRDRIVDECFKRGLLVLGAGANAIRFCPPLVVTRAEARIALEIFDEVLTAVERGPKRAR